MYVQASTGAKSLAGLPSLSTNVELRDAMSVLKKFGYALDTQDDLSHFFGNSYQKELVMMADVSAYFDVSDRVLL